MTTGGTNRLSVRKDTFTGLWIVRRDGGTAYVANTQPAATRWADRMVEDAARATRWRNGI